MKSYFLLSFSFAIVLMATFIVVESAPLSTNSLSRSERSAIKKLRLLVKDVLPHEYMKEDLYLLKWLTMRNFNVDQTVTFLKQHVRWRQEKKMDTILGEDWSQYERDYPFSINTVDKDGRPILYFRYGSWDISDAASSGNQKVLVRYFAMLLEGAESRVRGLREQGKNITQFDLIINLKGYSMAKHGCIQCLGFYSEIGDLLQDHFPGAANKIVFLNAPTIFTTTYGLMTTVLDEPTKDAIKIFGNDRHTWEPALLQFIDRDQFPGDIY